jgi:predicted nucleic acid-binding protein
MRAGARGSRAWRDGQGSAYPLRTLVSRRNVVPNRTIGHKRNGSDIAYNIIQMLFVLDTCVIVAAIRSGTGASSVLVRWALRRLLPFALTVSLAMEYEEVLLRPENAGGRDREDLDLLILLLFAHAVHVKPRYSYRPLLDDPADELVLEAAIAARADIVTFNVRHFRPAARFGVAVYRPGELLQKLRGMGYGEE